MKSFPLEGDDAKPDSPFKKIIGGTIGTPIQLSEAPTTVNGIVPEGEMGIFGTDLFTTANGITLKFSGTAV